MEKVFEQPQKVDGNFPSLLNLRRRMLEPEMAESYVPQRPGPGRPRPVESREVPAWHWAAGAVAGGGHVLQISRGRGKKNKYTTLRMSTTVG